MANAKPTTDASAAFWPTTITVGSHGMLLLLIALGLASMELAVIDLILTYERLNAIIPTATVLVIQMYVPCRDYWFIVPLALLIIGAADAWIFNRLFRRPKLRFLAAAWFYLVFAFLLLFVALVKIGLALPLSDLMQNLS